MNLIAALGLVTLAPSITLRQAAISLDPPEPLPLGGYTARQGKVAEPGGEPLFARVAVLKQGDREVALVSLEMLTVPESLVAKVREGLPPGTNLFMVATHTHGAPDSQMLNSRMRMGIPGIATYKEKWLEWYGDRILKGILAARTAPGMIVNFRTREFRPELNRARREHGRPDPWARVIETKHGPVVSVFAAHATIFDEKRMQTTGDWPGAIMRRGGLVFPGAIGDASPAAPDDKAPAPEKINAFTNRWFDTSRRAETETLSEELAFDQEPIETGPPSLHPDFARANGIPTALAQRLLDGFAPREASLTAVRLGNVVLLGVPGEPTSHVGWRIAEAGRRMGFNVWVVSHCNGWMGYIVDAAGYVLNGYEATLTMYGPETANRVTEAAERLLKKL